MTTLPLSDVTNELEPVSANLQHKVLRPAGEDHVSSSGKEDVSPGEDSHEDIRSSGSIEVDSDGTGGSCSDSSMSTFLPVLLDTSCKDSYMNDQDTRRIIATTNEEIVEKLSQITVGAKPSSVDPNISEAFPNARSHSSDLADNVGEGEEQRKSFTQHSESAKVPEDSTQSFSITRKVKDSSRTSEVSGSKMRKSSSFDQSVTESKSQLEGMDSPLLTPSTSRLLAALSLPVSTSKSFKSPKKTPAVLQTSNLTTPASPGIMDEPSLQTQSSYSLKSNPIGIQEEVSDQSSFTAKLLVKPTSAEGLTDSQESRNTTMEDEEELLPSPPPLSESITSPSVSDPVAAKKFQDISTKGGESRTKVPEIKPTHLRKLHLPSLPIQAKLNDLETLPIQTEASDMKILQVTKKVSDMKVLHVTKKVKDVESTLPSRKKASDLKADTVQEEKQDVGTMSIRKKDSNIETESSEETLGTVRRITVRRQSTGNGPEKPCIRTRASSDPGTLREKKKKVRFASSLSSSRRFSSSSPVRQPVGWSVASNSVRSELSIHNTRAIVDTATRHVKVVFQQKKLLLRWVVLIILWCIAILDPELIVRAPRGLLTQVGLGASHVHQDRETGSPVTQMDQLLTTSSIEDNVSNHQPRRSDSAKTEQVDSHGRLILDQGETTLVVPASQGPSTDEILSIKSGMDTRNQANETSKVNDGTSTISTSPTLQNKQHDLKDPTTTKRVTGEAEAPMQEAATNNVVKVNGVVQIGESMQNQTKPKAKKRKLPAAISVVWPTVGQQVRGPEISVRVEYHNINPKTNASHRGARLCVSMLSGVSQDMIGCVLLNVDKDTESGLSDLRLKNITPGTYQLSVALVSPARKLTRTVLPFEVLPLDTPIAGGVATTEERSGNQQNLARVEASKASASAHVDYLNRDQQSGVVSSTGTTCTTTCSTTCG